MKLIEDLLRDVPTDKHQQVLERALDGAWKTHQQDLEIIRDKSNPLHDEALKELIFYKHLATQALHTDLLNGSNFYPIATMLSRLDFKQAGIKNSWNKPGRVIVKNA